MKDRSDIVQALLAQDLDQVKRCLAAPGFDIAAVIQCPLGLGISPRPLTWLELAIDAPLLVPRGLPADESLQARDRCSMARIEIIQALVDAGADPGATGQPRTVPPLFMAISDLRSYARFAVAILLKAGADPNTKTQLQRTALHLAVLPNRVVDDECLHTVRMLLAHGANPNDCDDMQQTPLHWSIGNDYGHDVLMLLHEHGARWDLADNRQETPLDKLRSRFPDRADWWEAYPGFRDLQQQVHPSIEVRTGPFPRF